MKVLYVLRSLAHFPYHESVFRHLCASGYRVHVLFDRRTSRHFSHRAVNIFQDRTAGFTWDWLIRRNDLWRRPLFAAREVRSYANYLNHNEQSDYYLNRWEGYLPAPLKVLVKFDRVSKILASEKAHRRLAAFESWVAPSMPIINWLKHYRPDVVIASPINMRFSEEVEYIKAARALGIPTVVPVLSWDNLTTKGVFHVIPDLTFVWNRAQSEEAVRIHRVPQHTIVITGAPFFDKWFDLAEQASDREAFYRKVGLNPDEVFLLYLGSSANIAEDETWLIREILRLLRRHPDTRIREMKVVVRPHPANSRIYEAVKDEQLIVYPKKGELPDSHDSIQDFFYALRCCVATVGINTTGMIDAIIGDRPCITVITERYRSTQSRAVHFQYLLDAGVLEIAESPPKCVDLIEAIWKGRDSKKEKRSQFVREFIRPNGLHRPAGEIVGSAIRLATLHYSAERINACISDTGTEAMLSTSRRSS